MSRERVALASIRALTFYSNLFTNARRGDPIPQLTCVGPVCRLYQPDAVQCINVGGEGVDVNWKCEADLPEALRFGRVSVSCEGWSKPGDPYVLKGSCGLEYRLVKLSNSLYEDKNAPNWYNRWIEQQDLFGIIFKALWFAVLIFMIYSFIKPCLSPRDRAQAESSNPPPTPPGSRRGPGWLGPDSDRPDPPPPYPKPYPDNTAPGNWRSNFWTGLGLGAAGSYIYNRYTQQRQQPPATPFQRRPWDWETERTPDTSEWAYEAARAQERSQNIRQRGFTQARGEGEGSSSNLGSMRRSTGVGGSSVR